MESKNWTDSKTIRFLVIQWIAGVLLSVVPMLQTHNIDWWALGAQTVTTLATILIRMSQPDVVAPVAILNTGNKP